MSFTATTRALMLIQSDGPTGTVPLESGSSFAWMMLQTLLALGLVCLLIYALFRWVLPRLGASGSQRGMVRVVDAMKLEPRKSLYIVEVAGRWLLIASSEAGVQLISELEAETARQEAELRARSQVSRKSVGSVVFDLFTDGLARLKNRRS
jgi:flagellar biosynthetic protein FliO